METGWPSVIKELLQGRGVRTLISLVARIALVCGSVAIAVLVTADGALDSARLVVLAAMGAGVLLLVVVIIALGVLCPKKIHWGADEWMKEREQEWESRSRTPHRGIVPGDEGLVSGGDAE